MAEEERRRMRGVAEEDRKEDEGEWRKRRRKGVKGGEETKCNLSYKYPVYFKRLWFSLLVNTGQEKPGALEV